MHAPLHFALPFSLYCRRRAKCARIPGKGVPQKGQGASMRTANSRTLFILAAGLLVLLLLAGACRPPEEATGGNSPAQPAAIQESPSAPSPQAPAVRVDAPPGTPEELKKIFEVWSILSRDFVDPTKLDPKKGTASAIEGIIKSLDDPYTAYLSAENLDIDR